MPKLIIITPVTRPTNLPAIYNNLLSYVGRDFPMTWYVVFDKSCEQAGREWKERFSRSQNPNLTIITLISKVENAPAGNAHRNQVLILLESELQSKPELAEQWIYFLDDDNILHPEFCRIFIENATGKVGLLFFSSTDNKSTAPINITFNYFTRSGREDIKIPLSFFCVRYIYAYHLRIWALDPAYNYNLVTEIVERVPEKERKSFTAKTFDNFYS